jgi:hypothetical protein
MADLTNGEIAARVRAWQGKTSVHLLTCGNDPTHRPLEPTERDGRVVLHCEDCGYEQSYIPPMVLSFGPRRLVHS